MIAWLRAPWVFLRVTWANDQSRGEVKGEVPHWFCVISIVVVFAWGLS